MGTLVGFVLLLATSIWVGGFVAIAVVARISRHVLDEPTRIAFFRQLGRGYLAVGGGSLAVALGSGAILLTRGEWTPAKTVALALGVALAIATVAGIVQARSMTRMRRRAANGSQDRNVAVDVRSAAARAALLRASIGALTIALLAVGSAIAT